MTDQDPPEYLPARSRIVQRHLASAGINASIRELPASTRTAREAADALGCDVGAIASSLVFIADDKPLLVMTSGRHRVDTDVLKAALGATNLQMASASQVRDITGQAIGGVAPTGHPTHLPTVVDKTLSQHDTIWAAGGTPRTVVSLTYEALLHLTDGIALAVTRSDT